MSNERDELVGIAMEEANANGLYLGIHTAENMACAVLAAGYSKPRTITTADGLTELPNGAVIRDSSGDVFERRAGEWCGYETRPLTDKLLSKYLPVEVLA